MVGGNIPPTPPTPHGGGTDMETGFRKAGEDELSLKRRKKILDQDDEDWILFIHNLIVSQNLN